MSEKDVRSRYLREKGWIKSRCESNTGADGFQIAICKNQNELNLWLMSQSSGSPLYLSQERVEELIILLKYYVEHGRELCNVNLESF